MTSGARHPDARLERLIDQWLDDDLGPAESAELEAILAESPAARTAFWRQATFHSLIHEAVALAGPVNQGSDDSPVSSRWFGRAAGLLVAALVLVGIGGGVGSLVTSRALAGLAKASLPQISLFTDGFESGPAPTTGFIPPVPGAWGGDKTAITVGTRGVQPVEGRRMLEFLAAHADVTETEGQYSSEIWRILPMRTIRERASLAGADGGCLTLEFSAAFNQRGSEAGSGVRDPAEAVIAGINVFAFQGSVADAAHLWNSKWSVAVASASLTEILDEDPAGWQRLRVSIALPESTDFVLLQCYVGDDKADATAVFDGQFLDDVRVRVMVDPGQRGPVRGGGGE
jgi:hypothetical protein